MSGMEVAVFRRTLVGGGVALRRHARGVLSVLLSRQGAATVLLIVAIATYYLFVISAGRMSSWHTYSSYYGYLTKGFGEGHLHLSLEPSAALLALPNPYDERNATQWLWDATLYHGHYYAYWGPVPALLGLAAQPWRDSSIILGDEVFVLGFMTARLVAGAALITLLGARLSWRPPRWAVLLAIALFGLASPTPFVLARASVYEVAIAAGQCFLVLGWLCAFHALTAQRNRHLWLALASTAWGLVLGSRISLIFAVAVSVVITLACSFKVTAGASKAKQCLATLAPLAAAGASLAAYNFARFGRITEFGVTYQLTTMHFSVSADAVLSNAYSYLLRKVPKTCEFPFVHTPWYLEARAFPRTWSLPAGYEAPEPVAGMLRVTPFVWLAFAALILAAVSAAKGLTTRLARRLESSEIPLAGPHEIWGITVFLTSALVAIGPAWGMWMATMRYMEDMIGGIVLAATLGGWALLEWSKQVPRAWRYALNASYTLVVLFSVVASSLFGFLGYYDHFETNNPKLWKSLQQGASMCALRDRLRSW